MNDDASVVASGISKQYGSGGSAVHALRDVTVAFGRGAFTAVMGPSGSGKSTLLHCLAGLDSVSGGSVRIGEVELTGLSDTELTLLRREKIGFIFQSFNLLPTLTARQNILLPLRLAGRSPDQEWFTRIVDTLRISDRLDHYPHELSGGQQMRVATARAMVTRPEVIFADEPTGNLDTGTGADLLGLLRASVRELGQTIVMVTHDPIAAGYADRVLFLVDGRIVSEILQPTADIVLDTLKKLETA